jgi:hypothetical protein
MGNYIEIEQENGEIIKVELVFAFRVEELNKDYIAYTINDDPKSEIGMVLISEFDTKNNKIEKIPANEKDIVLKTYEAVKMTALADNED